MLESWKCRKLQMSTFHGLFRVNQTFVWLVFLSDSLPLACITYINNKIYLAFAKLKNISQLKWSLQSILQKFAKYCKDRHFRVNVASGLKLSGSVQFYEDIVKFKLSPHRCLNFLLNMVTFFKITKRKYQVPPLIT